MQATRKEYRWNSMQKGAFTVAAKEAWDVWVRNEAVEVLSEEESSRVEATLRQRGELHKVLQPRFVFTDKNDGLRTATNDLPIRASARLVVPGYKDLTAYELRKDSPTASRTSQHLLFSLAASNFKSQGWRIGSADVKSAFLKGEKYVDGARELYIRNMDSKAGSPTLPIGRRLSRLLKGVFGFSDAPREWFLRLRKSLTKEGWKASTMDAATFFLWSEGPNPRLLGVLCSHVDDLLFAGGAEAWASLERLGAELGFGSTENNAFTYCRKKVSQNLTTGEIVISMKEYHENLQPIRIAASRRRDPDAVLNREAKQLRALVGCGPVPHRLSVLQADSGRVQTAIRSNNLVKLFKATADFSLSFKPLDLHASTRPGSSS